MTLFQRVIALFSIVIASGFYAGCGGPGAPVPGGSEPAEEAADAALAPEGGPSAAEATETSSEGATAPETTESASEAPEDASAPESGN